MLGQAPSASCHCWRLASAAAADVVAAAAAAGGGGGGVAAVAAAAAVAAPVVAAAGNPLSTLAHTQHLAYLSQRALAGSIAGKGLMQCGRMASVAGAAAAVSGAHC